MAARLPASQRTREELTALIEGRLSTTSAKDELVKLASRRMVAECAGEVLNLLGNWRGASFAVIHQTGFGEPSKGAPHGSEITCFAADP
jgi:hypothetical protein